MIKAVFFDWFNTLAHFEPPREELHSQVYRQFGIELPPENLTRGLLMADRYWFEENSKSKVAARSPGEQTEISLRYETIILTETGVEVTKELLLKIIKKMQQLYKGITFALFDDVLPILKTLKEQNIILGSLSNIDKDIAPIRRKLGLEPYLDFMITSGEIGVDKPEAPIFLAALKQAGVKASEAIHVGDQYKLDVVGARRVGITPILIDRHDFYPEVSDCPRIHSLAELTKHL